MIEQRHLLLGLAAVACMVALLAPRAALAACPPAPPAYDGTDPVVAELRASRAEQAEHCVDLENRWARTRDATNRGEDWLRGGLVAALALSGASLTLSAARTVRVLFA